MSECLNVVMRESLGERNARTVDTSVPQLNIVITAKSRASKELHVFDISLTDPWSRLAEIDTSLMSCTTAKEIVDYLNDLLSSIAQDLRLYRAKVVDCMRALTDTDIRFLLDTRHEDHACPRDMLYVYPFCTMSDDRAADLGLLDTDAVRMTGRRMRDNPLTSDEFQQYLSDLSMWMKSP